MKYRMGEPGTWPPVERREYVAYLRRCADEWENLPCYGGDSYQLERRSAHKRQAERIRARAFEILGA